MSKRLFGLIGFPLGHSFSEQYFTRKFAQMGIADAEYSLFPLPDLTIFPEFLADQPQLCGLNVTIPHKTAIIRYMDAMDESAKSVGAVNCIKISQGRLIGYNTDVFGFEAACPPSFWQALADKQRLALVLGAGGASKAVAYVLRKWGIPFKIISRKPDGENRLAYTVLSTLHPDTYQLIVNTTPLGMAPDTDSAPEFPYDCLRPDHVLYDLVYNPEQTVFLQMGAAMGCRTISGLPMLYAQAEKSWQIWESK